MSNTMNHTLKLLLAATITVALSAEAQIRPPLGGSGVGNAPSGASNSGSAALLNPPSPSGGGGFVSQNEQALEQQASGNYPTMNRSSTLPIGAIQKKWSAPQARTGQTAPGIMRYIWRADFVMRVITREFMTTTIELPAWETVERIILGDTMVFEASRVKKNVLVVRPTHAGADSNMTVIGTSGNIYNFYLISEGWNSKHLSDLTVYVRANDPIRDGNNGNSGFGDQSNAGSGSSMSSFLSAAKSKAKDGEAEYLRTIDFDPSNLQFDMKLYAQNPKDIAIAPERVYHDGIWTYFDYGDKADSVKRPVIHQVVDGVDTVVNSRTIGETGNIIVAEAVGDFTLRNGRRVICAYRGTAPQAFPFKVIEAQPQPYLRRADNREPSFWDRVFGRKGAPTSDELANQGITRGAMGGQYSVDTSIPELSANEQTYANTVRAADLNAMRQSSMQPSPAPSTTIIAPEVEELTIDTMPSLSSQTEPRSIVPIPQFKTTTLPSSNAPDETGDEWAPDNFVSVIR